jgi:hypothetical protein
MQQCPKRQPGDLDSTLFIPVDTFSRPLDELSDLALETSVSSRRVSGPASPKNKSPQSPIAGLLLRLAISTIIILVPFSVMSLKINCFQLDPRSLILIAKGWIFSKNRT